MSKTVDIGYTSDTAKDYAEAIRNADTLLKLKRVVNFYSPLTEEAIAKVKSLSANDFNEFRQDLPKLETATGKQAEQLTDRWGDIVLPEKMLKVGMVSAHFGAPFGTAYLRMQEKAEL